MLLHVWHGAKTAAVPFESDQMIKAVGKPHDVLVRAVNQKLGELDPNPICSINWPLLDPGQVT